MVLNVSKIKKYAWIVPALLLAYLAIYSLRFGSASLDYYRVKNILEEWQIQGNQQSSRQYTVAKSAIQRALDKHPTNPLYVDTMGQIYEWGAIAGYEDDRQVALGKAKDYYLASTVLRPSWPVTWASLAMVKWRLQEFDEEMLFYLNQADRLGPYKPEVHMLFVNLGFALYQHDHPMLLSIRTSFNRRLGTGLRNTATRYPVLNQIKAYDIGPLICRWLKEEPVETQDLVDTCKSINKKRTGDTIPD